VPILSRIVVHGDEAPTTVRRTLDGDARIGLAHSIDDAGNVERLFLNMWLDVYGPKGRSHGPTPDGAGERDRLGRCFAEHVFTRPFGPPEARKVKKLELEGFPEIPPDRYDFRSGEELLVVPNGTISLDDTLVDDDVPIHFSIGHTDSNQHVNSLVYPRLFEEAALRRFGGRGRSSGSLLARRLELAYRKPCFAGDRVRIRLRAFEDASGMGACGTFVPDGGSATRPHAYARIYFSGSGSAGRT